MKKKVDRRVRETVESGVKLGHRTLLVLVGDKGKDQVVNLHYMLSKVVVKARPSVLWCYKNDLGFTTHRKKRMREIQKMSQRGLIDPETENPFDLFISATNIRFAYYKDSHKVIGNTYGMCVLQDFEALTPNILARTIETVEGGGLIVILLRTMTSLKQLYSLTMDVHSHFKTASHSKIRPRFNERFILSLANCRGSLVLDDELNILPISRSELTNHLTVPISDDPDSLIPLTPEQKELKELKESLRDTPPVGNLVSQTATLHQAKAVLTFIEGISEKNLRSTVTLTAARGRGKSAALGIAIAAAVAYGYANIFVTAPSPENLRTLFEFVFKGLDALEWKEHTDYTLVKSTQPEMKDTVVRVNIFRNHRQTIQYIRPQDAHVLTQAELVVIDEAAAIPLPLVKNLLGPYLVFMSSTINGYEGTGRSLSLKLIAQLRKQSAGTPNQQQEGSTESGVRVLREIQLEEPLRYRENDGIEEWLNNLLCLNAEKHLPKLFSAPHPSKCSLYHVNRDVLFSFHPASEAMLQRMMALYVASHYKNSPNDLQLLSDAPAHQLFVLLGPQTEATQQQIPDVLCVLQVALEGQIPGDQIEQEMGRGQRSSGDLIPWTLVQQFQDSSFGSLAGARVVRIACHPDMLRMGYGSRACELLNRYFLSQITDLDENVDKHANTASDDADQTQDIPKQNMLQNETLAPKSKGNVLLQPLAKRRPEHLHWLGTSFGLTADLFGFWNRNGYVPVYLRQTPNELTGEFTSIMIKALNTSTPEVAGIEVGNPTWLTEFHKDFQKRFRYLLGSQFRMFEPPLALSVLTPNVDSTSVADALTAHDVNTLLTPYDLKRLEMYSKNLVDHHIITDTLPVLAHWFFGRRLPVSLSLTQSAILAGCGLQFHSVDEVAKRLNLAPKHLLGLFNKMIRKISTHLTTLKEAELATTVIPSKTEQQTKVTPQQLVAAQPAMNALAKSLDRSLNEGAVEAHAMLAKQQQKLMKQTGLDNYMVTVQDNEWDKSLAEATANTESGAVPLTISVKANERVKNVHRREGGDQKANQQNKRKGSFGGAGSKKRFKNI